MRLSSSVLEPPSAPAGTGAPPALDTGNRPVRVMHVVYTLRAGGMEYGVVKVVNGLDPGSVRSAICSTTPAGALKDLVNPGVPVYELARRQGNDPRLVWDLYRLFRRERPDVVHTHAWGTLFEGLVAARLARVPIVIHGEHGTLQVRSYQRWLQRWGWGAADHLLSVSSRLADRLAREMGFPRERIRTIRNGVDLARFGTIDRAAARATLGLEAERLVVVAVGRLVPVKDHQRLLEALAQLGPELAGMTLLLAGDGPLRTALAALARTLGVDVRMLGHRSDIEVVLAAGDLFVQSSESEGLSNTILEAMASGLPVVATHVGGADEMVCEGETGLLVRAQSAPDLARAIGEVLRDPAQRAAMGTAGRRRAEAEFSLTGMIRQYEALYRSAACPSTRPQGRCA